MKPLLVYIHVVGPLVYRHEAERFVKSYEQHPPGCDHETVIVVNGGLVTEDVRRVFAPLQGVTFFEHNNTGQDIGGYIALAKRTRVEMMICLASSTHFWREGWMTRMVEAWETHGPGVYGAHASYECTPHFHTTSFWCPPRMLAEYPFPVGTRLERYNFEHGRTDKRRIFWRLAFLEGRPCKLVTLDGEYDWWDWRTPPNIIRRGDQSNVLTLWKHTDLWASWDRPTQEYISRKSDRITDTEFDRAARKITERTDHAICQKPERALYCSGACSECADYRGVEVYPEGKFLEA